MHSRHALAATAPGGASEAPPSGTPASAARVDLRLMKDPYRLAMLMLIVLSISKLSGYYGILRVTRPAFLLFGFSLVYAIANPRKLANGSIFRFWPARAVMLMGIAACCSAVFGISLGRSASFILFDYWKTLAFTFLLMTGVRYAVDLRRMVWAVALGGVVLAYLSIFVVGISKQRSGVTYDANDVGVIMLTALPLLLLLIQTSTGRLKLLAVVGLALVGATIAKTQSRGAFLGLLGVGGALLVLLPGVPLYKRALSVIAAAACLAIAAPPGYWVQMRSILEDPKADYNWDSLNGRRNVARRGVQYMVQYPVFGIGINNFPMAEGTISDKARNAPINVGVRWTAAHNSYVQAGAETGVIGLVLWLTMLGGGIAGCWRLRYRMPRGWRTRGSPEQRFLYLSTIYLPISFIGFAVSATFVSFAWSEPIYILTALVMGIYVAHQAESSGPALPSLQPPPGRGAARRQHYLRPAVRGW